MKTLHLTLSKEPFEVMATGEKTREYRKPSQWMFSRLWQKKGEINFEYYDPKQYDAVKFTNGYKPNSPYFIVEYKGFFQSEIYAKIPFSNGLIVSIEPGDYVLKLGKILKREHCI